MCCWRCIIVDADYPLSVFKPFGVRFIIVINVSYSYHKCRQVLQLTSKFVLIFFFFLFLLLSWTKELKMTTLRNSIFCSIGTCCVLLCFISCCMLKHFSGVEPDKLQVEDQPHWPHWLFEYCYCLSWWLIMCFWWQGKILFSDVLLYWYILVSDHFHSEYVIYPFNLNSCKYLTSWYCSGMYIFVFGTHEISNASWQ
jgi:hypothetical protein